MKSHIQRAWSRASLASWAEISGKSPGYRVVTANGVSVVAAFHKVSKSLLNFRHIPTRATREWVFSKGCSCQVR